MSLSIAPTPFSHQFALIPDDDGPSLNDGYSLTMGQPYSYVKKESLSFLEKSPVQGDTILSTSIADALDIASVRGKALGGRKVTHILVVGTSLRTENFCNHLMNVGIRSSNREDFRNEISDFLRANHKLYYEKKEDCLIELIYLLQGLLYETSWLSSEEQFQRIQEIFKNNCFAYKRIDLREEDSCSALARSLQRNNLTIDTFCIENLWLALSSDARKEQLIQAIIPLLKLNPLIFVCNIRNPEELETLIPAMIQVDAPNILEIDPLLPPPSRKRDAREPPSPPSGDSPPKAPRIPDYSISIESVPL